MYYLQSRYYNPVVGRFVNADEAGFSCTTTSAAQSNAFVYCENRIISNSDPSGYFSIPRALITFGIDTIIWTAFSAGAAAFSLLTQPVKAVARSAGKAFIKSKMLGILRGFSKTLANAIVRIAKFLVPIIQKAVGWLFRKWAAELTANTLAATNIWGIAFINSKFIFKCNCQQYYGFLIYRRSYRWPLGLVER